REATVMPSAARRTASSARAAAKMCCVIGWLRSSIPPLRYPPTKSKNEADRVEDSDYRLALGTVAERQGDSIELGVRGLGGCTTKQGISRQNLRINRKCMGIDPTASGRPPRHEF